MIIYHGDNLGFRLKLIYLVLDGMSDRLSDPITTLESAEKPGLDYIASKSRCGLMYTMGKGIAPESDEAVISLLGYDPRSINWERPFRGPGGWNTY